MERYTRAELAAATGVPTTTLDYWERVGLLTPSLMERGFTAREFSLGLVLADLTRLGIPGPLLPAVLEQLGDEPAAWPETLFVSLRGAVSTEDTEASAWVVHPRLVLHSAMPNLLFALAS